MGKPRTTGRRTIMNTHVTSLSLSRALYEVGLRVKTIFEHQKIKAYAGYSEYWRVAWPDEDGRGLVEKRYPALLASELGELLPSFITVSGDIRNLMIVRNESKDEWCAGYFPATVETRYGVTMPEAMGSMLLHLIREGLVDVKSLT